MKYAVFILTIILLSATQINAQDNVAEIAHAFIRAVKENKLEHIQSRFISTEAAYAILPKESAGMNTREKNEKYIKPYYTKFTESFNNIQQQIIDGNINAGKIDLVSYKLEKMSVQQDQNGNDPVKPQAMSLFFYYNKKENNIPVSVVLIDERWFILEILDTDNLFE